MSSRNNIPKSLDEKLADLDSHLFLVREQLKGLRESPAHLKLLSAELRALLCKSSGVEGLLWRLAHELEVPDKIFLHVAGDLNTQHPLARGLQFLVIPLKRGGQGDPQLPPENYSLKKLIKERQPVIVGGRPITHEDLIKMVAQQMGVAHEAPGVEPALAELRSIFINGVEPYIPVLTTDAELALEIGERVLESAKARIGYTRLAHSREQGNLSLVVSLRLTCPVYGRLPLARITSHITGVSISAFAVPEGVEFVFRRHGVLVGSLVAPVPTAKQPAEHHVFCLSYSSRSGQARTLVDGKASAAQALEFVGWLHTNDFTLHQQTLAPFGQVYYALTYERLLSSEDSSGLAALPPSGYGLWRYSEELEQRGEFPE